MRGIETLLAILTCVWAEDVLHRKDVEMPEVNIQAPITFMDYLHEPKDDESCYPGIDTYEDCPSRDTPCDQDRHYKRCDRKRNIYVPVECQRGFKYDQYMNPPGENETHCTPCDKRDKCDDGGHGRKRRAASGDVGQKTLSIRHQIITDANQGNLGVLFSANSDRFFTDLNLWSTDTINANKQRTELGNTKTTFYAAETKLERMSKVDFSAEIKMSLLGGLIEISGSASYLDRKEFNENILHYNMMYTATTHAFTLPTDTPKDFTNYCPGADGNNPADPSTKPGDIKTHVVTSVVYGANAVFEFKKRVTENESKQKISGSLQAIVKSIPSVSIDAQINLEAKLKREMEKMKISVTISSTIQQALQTSTDMASVLAQFKKLPTYLGKAPEYAQTQGVRVTLTPLSFFCSAGDAMVRALQKSVVQQMTTALDELERTKATATTMLADNVVEQFPNSLQKVINGFVTNIETFTDVLKDDLKKMLPSIRGGANVVTSGQNGQGGLISLLRRYKDSPFQFNKAEMWLSNRQREVVALKSVQEYAKASSVRVFESRSGHDCNRNLRINILNDATWTTIDSQKSWLSDYTIVGKVGAALREYSAYAKANKDYDCFGVIIQTKKADQAYVETIHSAIKRGKRYNIPTTVPKPPPTPEVIERRTDGIKFKMPPRPTHNTGGFIPDKKPKNPISEPKIIGFNLYYREYQSGANDKQPWIQFDTQRFSDNPAEIDVNSLRKGRLYQFQARYKDDLPHVSVESPTTRWVSTLPTDAPVMKPGSLVINTDEVTIEWDPPTLVDHKSMIDSYVVYLSGGCRGKSYVNNMNNMNSPATTSKQTSAESCHRSCLSDYKCQFWQWNVAIPSGVCGHHRTETMKSSPTDGVYITGERSSCFPVMMGKERQVNANSDIWQLDSPYNSGVELQSRVIRSTEAQNRVTFSGLRPATPYTLHVYLRTVTTRRPDETNPAYKKQKFVHESAPLEQKVTTYPLSPSAPNVLAIALVSAQVAFDTSVLLARDALNIQWLYKLSKYDSASDSMKVVRAKQLISATETDNKFFQLTGLVAETRYEVAIMVSTSKGDSQFSDGRPFKTLKSADALASMKQSIENAARGGYRKFFEDKMRETWGAEFRRNNKDLEDTCTNLYNEVKTAMNTGDEAVRQEMTAAVTRVNNMIKPIQQKLNQAAHSPVELRSALSSNTLQTTPDGRAYGGDVFIRGRPLCYSWKTKEEATKCGKVLCNELGYGMNVNKIREETENIGRADYVYKKLVCDDPVKTLWNCEKEFEGADRICTRNSNHAVYIECDKTKSS